MSDVLELIKLSEGYADVEVVEPPEDRKGWLEERRGGVGGSDAGAICGVDKYRDALDVYLDKIGEKSGDGEENRHTKRGRKLEQIVAEEYLDRHPEDSLTKPVGTQIHPKLHWMRGNPDRIIHSPRHTTEGPGVLEIKVPSRHTYDKIRLEGIPPNYVLQMQHYLAVTGLKWGTFAVFNADKWELMLVEVVRDDKVIDAMTAIEEKFWNDCVVPRKPPKRGKKKEARLELPKSDGLVRDRRSDGQFIEAVLAYEGAQQQVKEAEEVVEAAKKKLLDTIHSEPGVYQTNERRIYYTRVDGRKTFDKKALANVKPLDRLLVWGAADARMLELLETGALDLNLSEFETKGNDFLTLRIFPHRDDE